MTSIQAPQPSHPAPTPSYSRQKAEPKPELKKSDCAFDEKTLYVTKETLEKEIPRGSAAARIARFKQFEQNGDVKVPMPSRPPSAAENRPGKLKIIETTPPETPVSNGRLKIHEFPPTTTTAKEKESVKLVSSPKKYSVPITVKTTTDDATTEMKPKKSPTKKKVVKNTLSPENKYESSLSPNSTSSAYHSAASSPTSTSSISPKSKSSGISSGQFYF
jgi:hypothetical protein